MTISTKTKTMSAEAKTKTVKKRLRGEDLASRTTSLEIGTFGDVIKVRLVSLVH
jgi:hypothetical protein